MWPRKCTDGAHRCLLQACLLNFTPRPSILNQVDPAQTNPTSYQHEAAQTNTTYGPTQTYWSNPDLMDQHKPTGPTSTGPTQTYWSNPDLLDQPRSTRLDQHKPSGPNPNLPSHPNLLTNTNLVDPTQTYGSNPNLPSHPHLLDKPKTRGPTQTYWTHLYLLDPHPDYCGSHLLLTDK